MKEFEYILTVKGLIRGNGDKAAVAAMIKNAISLNVAIMEGVPIVQFDVKEKSLIVPATPVIPIH